MAITKLLHQKECKRTSARHLKNAIAYILNPQKTKDGLLVGGNCGTKKAEIYRAMLQTKKEFEKEKGRQGYHFIISFSPGEADVETAYRIGQEFCDAYLQDRYDYVFAVHTDKEHLHIHVVFNSVSYDGYKYHYSPGDWEKGVQPVTDRICRKYGLSAMLFEEERKGKTYGEWRAEKKQQPTNRDMVRKDIDMALGKSGSYQAFLKELEKMGYQVRAGMSRKKGEYLAFTPPEAQKAYRSYTLGWLYSPDQLKERVSMPYRYKQHSPVIKNIQVYNYQGKGRYLSAFQFCSLARYYRSGLRYASSKGSCFRYKKDILAIDRLYQQCRYLWQNDISSRSVLKERGKMLWRQEKELKAEMQALILNAEEQQILSEYERARRLYKSNPETEEYADQLAAYRVQYPIEEWMERLQHYTWLSGQLEKLREEKRLVRRIEKEDHGWEEKLQKEQVYEKRMGRRK